MAEGISQRASAVDSGMYVLSFHQSWVHHHCPHPSSEIPRDLVVINDQYINDLFLAR